MVETHTRILGIAPYDVSRSIPVGRGGAHGPHPTTVYR